MILTPDYLRGFYDGVTHKDTPLAGACRNVEKNINSEMAVKAAKMLRRYCKEHGRDCKSCPFIVDSKDTICALRDDLLQDWTF